MALTVSGGHERGGLGPMAELHAGTGGSGALKHLQLS
jgi:hypothetical protein